MKGARSTELRVGYTVILIEQQRPQIKAEFDGAVAERGLFLLTMHPHITGTARA